MGKDSLLRIFKKILLNLILKFIKLLQLFTEIIYERSKNAKLDGLVRVSLN